MSKNRQTTLTYLGLPECHLCIRWNAIVSSWVDLDSESCLMCICRRYRFGRSGLGGAYTPSNPRLYPILERLTCIQTYCSVSNTGGCGSGR